MIRIDRNRVDGAGRPIRPDDAWFELSRQWTGSALDERGDHDVKDHVYRHPSVKTALEELFHRTPLGEVDWQEDLPLWGDPETGAAAGKANQFPVEDEALRSMRHEDDSRREKPLLLDPCSDDPKKSFLYNLLGEIQPANGDNRAEVSIQVFHLTRRRLRNQRKKRIDEVVNLLKIIRDRQSANDAAAVADFNDFLQRFYLSDACEYAGAARFVRSDPDAFGI